MLEDVIAAFERKDYKTAAWLLKQLEKREPQNLWVRFYIGRLYEVSNKLENAEAIYRQLLKETTNVKIIGQARQGIKRLEEIAQEQRRQALAAATADSSSSQEGFLILEAIANDLKTTAAQKLAQILEIDAYTARLHLPSRGWRLYRTGALGKMRFYGEQMQQAGIPCFWAALADIEKINIFTVHYFPTVDPQATVVCKNSQNQLGSLAFDWAEVSQRVEGLLPIFEEVFDTNARREIEKKVKILDYVHFCDLHLPARKTILRICDRHYQFEQGADLVNKQEKVKNKRAANSPLMQTTTRKKWNDLLNSISHYLFEKPVWSEFPPFAETGLDQVEMLAQFKSNINLSPQDETSWDKAFQLYSGLVFLRNDSLYP